MTAPKAALMLLLAAAAASAYGAMQTSVTRQSSGDLYSAGASVQVSQPVPGDAVLAGGTVLIAGEIAQDVLAAAGAVSVTRAVGDDVRAAGGSVTVTDRVGGDVVAAGGSVTLAAGSVVDGNAWTAGGALQLSGTVRGGVQAAGGEVVLAGRVDGDVNVTAESLEVSPEAVIAGTLYHRGPRPATIAGEAKIGKVVYTRHDVEAPGSSFSAFLLVSLLIFVSLAACTLAFAWAMPNVCRQAAAGMRNRPVLSLGAGLVAVVVTPFAISALFVLVVTTPLAIALVACYAVLWIAGSFTALAGLAAWIRGRFMADRGEGALADTLSVLAAALVLWLLYLLPFVGALLVILAFVTGAGGLILLAARLYRQPDALQPA